MAASPQQCHVRLLEELPPELLGKIVDFCAEDIFNRFAHDVAQGRTTLLSLSVMNKYLRNVTARRLFERLYFRDDPDSPGDEILQSIRRFRAAPELWPHVRVVILRLNRLKWLGPDRTALTEPYHYLIIPELFELLASMPNITDLYIHLNGEQGARCIQGAQSAKHWSSAAKELNIRSLTVSLDSWKESTRRFESPRYDFDFLRIFPKLESFCFDGSSQDFPIRYLLGESHYCPPTQPALKQLRIIKTSSDPRTDFDAQMWTDWEPESLDILGKITPNLEHLSLLGELNFPVSSFLRRLGKIPSLKYVDVSDEQSLKVYWDWSASVQGKDTLGKRIPVPACQRLSYIFDLTEHDPLNENREMIAKGTFARCAQLRRICFVRSFFGQVFLRGYHEAVADSSGHIYFELNGAELDDIPKAWHHGVPQTSLLPFPGFTPWEGIDEFE